MAFMATLKEAKQKQDKLQKQASELLDTLNVEQELSRLGNFNPEGSYQYGLMVYGDIDLRVENSSFDIDSITEILRSFVKKPCVWDVDLRDYSKNKLAEPNGKYIKVRAVYNEEIWKIDIWFLTPYESVQTHPEPGLEPGWFEKLTQEEKDTILLLKANLWEKGIYIHKGVGSYHVYRAVMEGIHDVDNFLSWMEQTYGYRPSIS